MTSTDLWPPLALIRRSLTQQRSASTEAQAASRDPSPAEGDSACGDVPDLAALLHPLTELARQREALAHRHFDGRWAPGRLLQVVNADQRVGVLLDRLHTSADHVQRWDAWLAVPEADWASDCDVLLEPEDEPFEPLLGVVQVWNRVTVVPAKTQQAQVVGELSPTRLAALRAVAEMASAPSTGSGGFTPTHLARPGQIALRSVAGFTVLTGSPLGAEDDPRHAYQKLYADAARAWNAAQAREDMPARRARAAGVGGGATSSWGQRLQAWLGGGRLWQPAAMALALVVVVQNATLWQGRADDEELRLRELPGVLTGPIAAAPVAPDARIVWRPGTDMATAEALLKQADAQVIGGPDAQGQWSLRLLHPQDGRRVLQSSPWVELK